MGRMTTHAPVGLYVHIPFCVKKCHYCDFACYAGQERHVEAYLDALEAELKAYPAGLPLQTIYLGGGTPSILTAPQLTRLTRAIEAHFDASACVERTMEVNPGTGGPSLWEAARALGFTRLSLGVQSFDDRLLKAIGRDHAVEDVHRTYGAIREAGIDNVSLDLIYALPGQIMADWEATMDEAFKLDPSHFSVYGLILEERTVFGAWHRQGKLSLSPEDLEVAMGDRLAERMEAEGYGRYEISSWSKPGFEAVHNRLYWINAPYIGLGTGAHSYWQGRRFENPRGIQAFIQHPVPTWPEAPILDRRSEQEETVFLGLRMTREGLDKARYAARFGEGAHESFPGVFERLTEAGLVEDAGDRYRLTPRGIWLSNEVFAAFIA
ncbi:Oxygen-independent coproporphyrinogen-III oxidase 1 [compost metagenome]